MAGIFDIEEIRVHDGSIAVRLHCDEERASVPAGVAETIVMLLPGLPDQICVHSAHRRFGDEIEGTQTPHLLEHVTLELMMLELLKCDTGRPRSFTGHTSWRGSGDSRIYRVTFEFDDDLVALSAFREACALISACFSGCLPEEPIGDVISRVHGFRGIGR